MLVTLYKIGELHFRLLGTDGFHVKAKNERFTAANSRCRQNVKYENFTLSFGRLRQNIAPRKACSTCSTIIFLHSTNQIIDLWRCRWHCRRQILTYLMTMTTTTPQINDLIGWMKKNNVLHVRQAFWCNFFDVVCQTTTWNFHFSGFWRQRNPAVVKLLFLAFACQASESVFRLFCWPWLT